MAAIVLLMMALTLLAPSMTYEDDINSMYDYTPPAPEDQDFAYELENDNGHQDGDIGNHYEIGSLRHKRMFGAGLSRVPPYQWGLLEHEHAPEDPDDEDDDEIESRTKRTTKRMSLFRERDRQIEDNEKRNKKRSWHHAGTENLEPIYYMPVTQTSGSRKFGLQELLAADRGRSLVRDAGRFGDKLKVKRVSRPDPWFPGLEITKRSFDYQNDYDDDDDDNDNDENDDDSQVENVYPVAKRSVKRTDKNVMITLQKILADDDDGNNSTPSPKNVTVNAKINEAPGKVLRRAKKSWDDYVGIDKRSSGAPKKPVQDWAVDWYLKSMARTMSNKRKRGVKPSTPKPTQAPKLKGNEKVEQNEIKAQIISAAQLHQSTDDRLKGIEKVVLEQASDLIRGEHGHGHPNSDSHRILNRLDVAYNLENLRQALENFELSLIKMKDEDQDFEKKSSIKPNVLSPEAGINASHLHDATNRNSNSIARNSDSRGVTDVCDGLKSILRHCVGLSRTVGDPTGALVGPCIGHVICHSCASNDASASECAPSFLWSASKVCGENFRCQTAAGAIRSVIISDLTHLGSKEKHLCPPRHCIDKLDEVTR